MKNHEQFERMWNKFMVDDVLSSSEKSDKKFKEQKAIRVHKEVNQQETRTVYKNKNIWVIVWTVFM